MLDMTQGSPMRKMLAFSIPVLVGNVLNQVYSLTDSIIVGRVLGVDALAAVGCTMPIVLLLAAVMIGVNAGVSILLSQAYGSRDINLMRRYFANSIYLGLLVALFILYSGITLAKDTVSPLLGENVDPALQEDIVKIVESEPLVLGYHDLMVHDYGPGQRFASMHVEMDERESALHCHEVIDNLERICLKELNVHLVIHYDPIVTGDEQLEYMRNVVLSCLQEQDQRISIHDFRMVKGQGHTNLIFDIALPAELMPAQKKIKALLDEKLNCISQETLYTVVNFDLANFNA